MRGMGVHYCGRSRQVFINSKVHRRFGRWLVFTFNDIAIGADNYQVICGHPVIGDAARSNDKMRIISTHADIARIQRNHILLIKLQYCLKQLFPYFFIHSCLLLKISLQIPGGKYSFMGDYGTHQMGRGDIKGWIIAFYAVFCRADSHDMCCFFR